MTQDSKSRLLDKIVIRVPDGLRDRIAAEAKRNNRSVNAELVQLLEQRFPPEPPASEIAEHIRMFIAWAQNKDAAVRASGRHHLLHALVEFREQLEREISRSSNEPGLPTGEG